MDTRNTAHPADGGLSVEPLKPRRSSRMQREIAPLLAAVQEAISADLHRTKQDIVRQIRNVEASLDIIAREMARKATQNGQSPVADGDSRKTSPIGDKM